MLAVRASSPTLNNAAMGVLPLLATAVLTADVFLSLCSRAQAFFIPFGMSSQRRPQCSSSCTPNPKYAVAHRSRCISGLALVAHPASRRPRAAATPHMAFDPDITPGVLDAFHAWLTKSGVKLGDNIVLAGRSPLSGGRGLTTTKTIENGQQVLAIPQSLGVTAAGVKNSGIAKYLIGYEGWTGDTGLIALQLLWERAQEEKSIMAPWIAAMPAMGELEMPLFWDEEDLALADASSTRVRESRRCLDAFPSAWRRSLSVRL